MDSRTFAAQAAPYLAAILLAVLGYLARAILAAVARSSVSARVKTAVEQVVNMAIISAERTTQVVVADLKDPAKPGAWDEVAKRSARESVEADVRALARGALETLRTEGRYTPEEIDTLLDRAIESAVSRVKARVPSVIEVAEIAEPLKPVEPLAHGSER